MPSLSPMHVLQFVCWTAKTREGAVAAGGLRCEGDALHGSAGDEVVLDGIFGAFFDGYWAEFTSIGDLALTFTLVGWIEISIERIASSTGEREQIVCSRHRGSNARIIVPVPLAQSEETRLSLTIKLVTDSSISAPAWATSTPPVRVVGLTGIICTFNRDKDLAATLVELLEKDSGLRQTLVVNQGKPGLAERLGDLYLAHGAGVLTIIDQSNLGGAGGFGRGMLETLSDDGCSHVLLMDDDIDLDAVVVKRLIAILSYLRPGYALGGAMLDRSDRAKLFSVGDVLHDKKPEIRNLVDPGADDITSEPTTRYLARHHRPDFSGWWFCAVSKEQIGKAGLPLPLFIRGDDVEYGYRLTVSGIRTLAWPGLAVWHEPFHTKRHPWHYFYDRRNSLFLCEMHGRFGRLRLFGALVIGFLNHLLRFDYDRAGCITLGLRAFNDGAEGLKHWRGGDHGRLAMSFGSKEYAATPNAEIKALPASRVPMLLLFAARLVRDLTLRASQAAEPITVPAQHWRPVARCRPLHVRVHYEDSKSMADFSHDRHRARACCRAFAREITRFLMRRWRPARLVALTRRDFWSYYTAQPL